MILIILALIIIIVCVGVNFANEKTKYPLKYYELISSLSKTYNIDIYYIYGIIKTESGFNEMAKSDKGALGLMQLLPSTALYICKENNIEYNENNLFNSEYNIKLGCLYFKYLIDKFTTYELALLAYNSGEGRLRKWLEEGNTNIINYPYPESRNYLKKIYYNVDMFKNFYYLY